MKLSIILFIIFSSIILTKAQKYEDIVQLVKDGQYSRAYPFLMEAQKKDPDNPNPYFHLGNISYDKAIHSNFLKDFDRTEYYISNTKLFYSLCIKKLTENPKDARRNDDLYKTVDDLEKINKLNNDSVIAFIDKRLKKIEKYDENIKSAYENFNGFLNSYIKSVEFFKQLVSKYPKINDLYLEQKSVVYNATDRLISSYDSTDAYFKLYKKDLDNTPETDYSPSLKKLPIKLYRLEGLTRSDFLADTLYVWDYSAWAKNVRSVVAAEITDLRETIIKTNLRYNQIESQLKNSGYTNSFNREVLDQKVYFKIEKYDYNSLVSRLFYYRVAKINYWAYSKRIFNDTSNYSISPDSRIKQFYEMTGLYDYADSLLSDFNTSINEESYKKHKEFFDVNYKGLNGLHDYVKEENMAMKKIMQTSVRNLFYITYRDVLHLQSKFPAVDYKNGKISQKVSDISTNDALPGQYYTKAISTNKTGDKYITGFYKVKNSSAGFIAKIYNNQIVWIKILSLSPGSMQSGVLVKALQDGCIVVFHSLNNGKHYNHLVRFNADGKQLTSGMIQIPLMPRLMDFDDINARLTLAFHGTKPNYYGEKSDSLVIAQFDFATKKLLWKENFKLNGTVIGLVKTDSIYNIYANYSRFSKGQTNLLNDKTNILHLKVGKSGQFQGVSDLLPEYFNFGVYTFKINAETMAIIGFNNKLDIYKKKYTQLPQPYLIIFDKNDKIIFDSFKK